MFNPKYLSGKKLFKLIIMISIYSIINTEHNTQINKIRINQISQSKINNEIDLVDSQKILTKIESLPEEESNYFLSPKDVAITIIGVFIGSLILLLYVFSPVVVTKQGSFSTKANFINTVFPRVIEGITVILIVLVVTLLSLVDKIDPQGAISILSALVGYVLGKQQELSKEREEKNNIDNTQPEINNLEINPNQQLEENDSVNN